MRQRWIKIAILSAEVVGVLLAIAAVGAAWFFWRLNQGPVALGFLKGPAEQAISRQLPDGHRAAIKELYLERHKQDGSFDLVLDRPSVSEEGGRAIIDLESATFNFTAGEVMAGRFYPRRISLGAAEIDLRRGADRRFRVDYGAGGAGKTQTNISRLLKESAYFRDVFERAELVEAKLTFFDEITGRRWRSENASARVVRDGAGYAAMVSADFDNDGRPSHIRMNVTLDQQTERINASLDVKDAPLSDFLEIFYGPKSVIMTAPVTGKAEIEMTQKGEILSSRLEGRAVDGLLLLGGGETVVNDLELAASFDPARNEFTLARFRFDTDRAVGAIDGRVSVNFIEEGGTAPRAVQFDLASTELTIGANDFFQGPVQVDRLQLQGVYDLAPRRLAFSQIDAALAGVVAKGGFTIERPRGHDGAKPPSPAMSADIAVTGALGRRQLLSLWPVTLGHGARDFLRDRITKGTASNLRAKLDVAAGAVDAEGGLPNDALTVTFDLNDADIIYAPGMTPLTQASGAAILKGNQFLIDVPSARVGDIALSNGEVDFTAFRPRGAPSYFRFDAKGQVRDILTVLDQEPLALLTASGMAPSAFAGDADAHIEIMRPNRRITPRSDYRYKGKARFSALSVEGLQGGINLNNGVGTLDLGTQEMRVVADAQMGEAPIKIDWLQRFSVEKDRSHFRITGEVDSATGDIFGIPSRQFLRGAVAFEAEAMGDLGDINTLTLNTDFTNAALLAAPIGWIKPRGAPATGKLTLAIDKERTALRDFNVSGAGVDIKGEIDFSPTGRVERGVIDRLYLEGAADISLRADRAANGGLELAITGDYLNAGSFIEATASAAGAASAAAAEAGEAPPDAFDVASINWGDGIAVNSRLDTLELRNGVRYADADVEFWRDATRIQTLSVSARDNDGDPLSMELSLTGDNNEGPRQTVEARTDDIGALLSGVFGVKSIIGGQGVVDLFVLNSRDDGKATEKFAGLSGVVEARQMTIVGMPLLAKVFSAGSFTGLTDLLNGEGIELSQAFAQFAFQDGALILRDLRAAGPSVGLSAEGRIAGEASGGVDLNGAVAPAYQVNSFLGKAPLVGDLFVNRAGEGVVALSYKVKGPAAAPTISVNPLSALTPGFLRRIFEPQRPSLDEIMDPDENQPPAQETPPG